MVTIDLDKGEEIDYIKLNGREYEVGKIPVLILKKIDNVDTTKGIEVMLQQRREITKEILEVRNDYVNMDAVSDEKLSAFIQYVLDKVRLRK